MPVHVPPALNAKLWPHQRRAIQFAVKYLRQPAGAKIALIRMPTGTGKTGVIATLSVAAPPIAWTLILTPWRHLCRQMMTDVKSRFWNDRAWAPDPEPEVVRLYPKTIDEVLEKKAEKLIVVATFATLVAIFKRRRARYDSLAKKLSQIFVDEGHYEPAVEWGQAVKQLHCPTVLLTATPYRNDLKLFRVAKEDVHNYTHAEAEEDGIIRRVEFRPLPLPEPSDRQLEAWCNAFREFWSSPAPKKLHPQARCIICCSKMATVERVTRTLRGLGLNAIGIHEGFRRSSEKWLMQHTPEPKAEPSDIWVHQHKLTEGLDDNRFCVVAILNRISNDRKLIQQIGRVLRRSDNDVGAASVLYSQDLEVEQSWKNYREFETQPELVDPERYREILDTMLARQPHMEYFAGRFRRRFEPESPKLTCDVRLTASAAVRRVGHSFKWQEFIDFTSDFLVLEDRILLGATRQSLAGPGGSRLWVYAVFGNSPRLIEHSQYEVRLGAMAAVQHKDLLFLVDTESLYPSEYLNEHTSKVTHEEFGRVLDKNTIPREVAIKNPWPAGPSIRRSTINADDLSSTPARLTDAAFVCSAVRARDPKASSRAYPTRRYVGFERGRIAEQIRSSERDSFDLAEFVLWTAALSKAIADSKRERPAFFKRYLSPIAPPSDVHPEYLVLNLFEGDVELEDTGGETVDVVDSIIPMSQALDAAGNPVPRFRCDLTYHAVEAEDEDDIDSLPVTLSYEEDAARFRFQRGDPDESLTAIEIDSAQAKDLATYLNNNDEAFTVALREPDIFYTSQAFYQIDYSHAETKLESLISAKKELNLTTSEKGKKGVNKTSWDTHSLFGYIDDRSQAGLIRSTFGKPELLLCDDLGTEVADFVCASFTRRKITFIHAKHSEGHAVSASALHDAVSQALKNLGVLARAGSLPANLSRWDRRSVWSKTKIKRWRIGSNALPVKEDLWAKIRAEILDHPDGIREVWLVLGQTLDKAEFMKQLRSADRWTPVTGQVVHLLSGLHANCTQINVQLRVFSH